MNKTTFGVGVTVAFAAGMAVTWFLKPDHLNEPKVENARLETEGSRSTSSKILQSGEQKDVHATATVDQTELERLRNSRNELLKLRGSANAGVRETERLKAELAQAKESAGDGTNMFGGAMGDMMKEVMQQQVVTKVAKMKTKLNLTPEQEQSISDLYSRQSEVGVQMAQKVFGGKVSKDDLSSQVKSAGNIDAQIQALLTPEQQAGYKDYQAEERTSNAKMVAGVEVMQMQSMLSLSPQQQEQVTQVFVNQHVADQSPERVAALGTAGTDPMAIVQQQFDSKLKAVEGILTPDQMTSYRQYQESQMKMVQKLLESRSLQPKPVVP